MTSQTFLWVSPYATDDTRGGWKSMQFHLLQALEQRWGSALRIAPVEVAENFVNKWVSRFQKQVRIPRRYAYYSESRLALFARAVEPALAKSGTRPAVFFGALPFVKCRPKQPYFIYTDGAFFVHYWEYNQDHSHARSEVTRICAAEAQFMRGAAGVWCSSQWVADRIAKEYGLPADRVRFIGTGPGKVPPPNEPVRYEKFLVMITADFQRKQGRLAVEAVTLARRQGSDLGLQFIGARPPNDVLKLPFVTWCGWLNLSEAGDRARFADVLSRAGAHILLSRADLTPLAIPEAAVYSKATIATSVGGIPEMIKDGETGMLLASDASPGEIAEKLTVLFREPAILRKMGEAAHRFYGQKWNWEQVAEAVCPAFRSAFL